jgi:hypothetical protein
LLQNEQAAGRVFDLRTCQDAAHIQKVKGIFEKKSDAENEFFFNFKTNFFEVVAIMDKVKIAILKAGFVTKNNHQD